MNPMRVVWSQDETWLRCNSWFGPPADSVPHGPNLDLPADSAPNTDIFADLIPPLTIYFLPNPLTIWISYDAVLVKITYTRRQNQNMKYDTCFTSKFWTHSFNRYQFSRGRWQPSRRRFLCQSLPVPPDLYGGGSYYCSQPAAREKTQLLLRRQTFFAKQS